RDWSSDVCSSDLAAQREHMGDVATALDREHEVVRRFAVPAPEAVGMLQRIEAAIEFDGRKAARGMLELSSLRESGWIEAATPARIAPARNADAYASFGHRRSVPAARRGSVGGRSGRTARAIRQPPARPPPARPGS